MTVPLTWLLDGIAEVPANDAQVADLALDSREVRAGHLFFALRGRRSHGLEFVAEAAARGVRRALGAGATPRGTGLSANCVRGAGGGSAQVGGPHRRSVLRSTLFAALDHRHHRYQRQDPLSVPRGAVPRASRAHGGLRWYHWLGPGGRARHDQPY